MHLQFLGTGNAILPKGRASSLLIIDGHIMVDCPPDCLKQLRDANIDPASITAIIFTHWHDDHCAGFPMFALERQRISAPPLQIYGPPCSKKILEDRCSLGRYKNFLKQWLRETMTYCFDWNMSISGTNLRLRRFQVKHFDDVQANGYTITDGEHMILHTGDSAPCDEIFQRIHRCQVVVIEMGLDRPSDFHYCPNDIRELAAKFPNVMFLVTHTFCEVGKEPNLGKNVRHMQDGQEWPI